MPEIADIVARLTAPQIKALGGLARSASSAYELRVGLNTLSALERMKLIRVETTLGSIAFPHNARAHITPAGIAALKARARASTPSGEE